MTAKWKEKKGDRPDVVLQKLRPLVKTGVKGGLITTGPGERYIDILESLIEFHGEIRPRKRYELIREGVAKSLQEGTFGLDGTMECIRKAERAFLRKKFHPFVLVTTISIATKSPIRTSALGNRIYITQTCPERFKVEDVLEKTRVISRDAHPEKYAYVRVSVMGREPAEAVARGLDSVDFMRGVWNIWYAKPPFFSDESDLVNAIHRGPISTLHHPEGKPVSSLYWFEPSYRVPGKNSRIDDQIEPLRSQKRFVEITLRQKDDRTFLEECIIGFGQAVDEPARANVLTRLWNLMERLCLLAENDGHDKIIKRFSSLIGNKDREWVRQELRHLSSLRNRIIHGHAEDESLLGAVDRLIQYVIHMLRFHLSREAMSLTSEQLRRFLAAPSDLKEVQKSIQVFRTRVAYINSLKT